MSRGEAGQGQGAFAGRIIAGVGGLAWTEWGASGLSGALEIVVRVLGIVLGVAVVLRSVQLRRSAPRSERPMFSSGNYRRILLLELAAFAAGGVVLSMTGYSEYVVAWLSVVLGCHFLAFGRLFWTGFYWLGAVQVFAGVAGAIVGIAGGGRQGITAVAALITAASLLATGVWTVRPRAGLA